MSSRHLERSYLVGLLAGILTSFGCSSSDGGREPNDSLGVGVPTSSGSDDGDDTDADDESGEQGSSDGSGGTDSGNGSSETGSPGGSDSGEAGDEESDDDDGQKFDVFVNEGDTGSGSGGEGIGDCDEENFLPTDAVLKGTVYAPNLEVPISGALVYTTRADDIETVIDGAFCDECIELICNEPYTFTKADGSFELPTHSGPGHKLVVQKGQFQHITELDVPVGESTVEAEVSSLPGEWNPEAGHYIPRIAIAYSDNDYYDTIHTVLSKIGLGEVDSNGAFVSGSEKFDLYGKENTGVDPVANMGDLLDDLDKMMQYHIIFIPCMSQEDINGAGNPLEMFNEARAENIRKWVEAGGKWYVTDWSNEYLSGPFPNYQTFYLEDGDPDLLTDYNSKGKVLDPDLLAWLEALPTPLKDIGQSLPTLLNLPEVTLTDNWSGIQETPEIFVENALGEQVNVGHYTWVEGPGKGVVPSDQNNPMTISGQYGCGKNLFSTYHTDHSIHTGLSPQELILFYIILEIGVCADSPPPPPPIIG